jgi:hypothetical protein
MAFSNATRNSDDSETHETQESQECHATALKPIRTGDCPAGPVETPQRAANAFVEREGFRVLKHLQREWDGLIGEVPIPYRLRPFQGELLDWARYRCVGAGPNWNPACLLPDLIMAARLGSRLKTAVQWGIKMRKEKLPDPKIDPGAVVDFDAWHNLKERVEDETLTQREILILQAISRQECKLAAEKAKGPGGFRYESHAGKDEFLQALLEDTGSRDLDRAERFFKLRAEA